MAEWNPKANEIFLKAMEIEPPEQRQQFVGQACGNDADLLAQVESLLQAEARAGSFLNHPAPGAETAAFAAAASPSNQLSERTGTVIGRYKLLQQIGEGGMGVVYMAEQTIPVRRKVALKIIKPGMDSHQVIARFEAERQALAMMDHPNIARVLDAGCTDTGRPYFVMELVQGIPITKYCDDKQLNTHERLGLFIQVCRAVQHAHQKGIIHRDIKPSNVLVMIYDSKPIPKIIDFGVAKALHQHLTEMTMFTQFGAAVGTLEYMSPEQAEMDALGTDTRSDIYSLGVLLYELLTGSTPMDGKKLRSLGYAEMLKTIREVEPPKPSTRLSQSQQDMQNISAQRHTEPRRLQKLIAGDLDWIVMKCLEKDRTRRYETANGLAMDIERHLGDETVTASPPGQFYKLQKLVRRNKLACAAVGCVTLALVIGLAASLWQAARANHEAARAQQEADRTTRAEANAEAALARETKLRKEAEGHGSIAKALNLCVAGDFSGAEKLISAVPDELIQQDPKTAANVFRALGNWNGGEPRWKQAAADFQAICFGPASRGQNPGSDTLSMDYLTYVPLLIELHDNSQYQKLYQSARLRLSDTAMGERMLNAFLLSPIEDEQRDVFIPWASQAQRTAKAPPAYACWSSAALGLLCYRQNHYEEALANAEQSLELHPPPTCQARAQLVLALAHARLNQVAEARSELNECRDVIEAKFAGHLGVGNYESGLWKDWLIDRILLREAEALIRSLPNSAADHAPADSAAHSKTWDSPPWVRKLDAAGIHFTVKLLQDGYYDVTVDDPKFTDCSIFTGSNVRRLALDRTGVVDLSPLANLPLETLLVRETKVTDLSPLRSSVLGKSLRELRIWRTDVTDMSAVAGCTGLEVFDAYGRPLQDLSMIKGMELKALVIGNSKVTDLSPVAGMPLEYLNLDNTPIKDVSPLLKCPTLKSLVLPANPENVESLRGMPNLTLLSYKGIAGGDPDKSAEKFWAEYDRQKIAAATRPTTVPAAAGG